MRSVSRGAAAGGGACALVALVTFASPPGIAAAGEALDPSYGRIEGDLTLCAGVGGVVAGGGPRAEGELRLRYLETAGFYAVFEDGLVDRAPAARRLLATGLELRPLFLYRWLQGRETRHAVLDLILDSLGLELGPAWLQPPGAAFASATALQAGVGAEIPLSQGASGPWVGVHAGVRWSEAALSSGAASAADREGFLALSLSWHQVVSAHVVDLGDRAPR